MKDKFDNVDHVYYRVMVVFVIGIILLTIAAIFTNIAALNAAIVFISIGIIGMLYLNVIV